MLCNSLNIQRRWEVYLRLNAYYSAVISAFWPSNGAGKFIFAIECSLHRRYLCVLTVKWRREVYLRLNARKSFFNFVRKITLLTSFFGYSATSEVKDQFYKVMDNATKYMYKNLRKNIITGSWIRTFLSYNLILNDFMDKNFRKGHTFLTIFFWLFSDLWG